MVPPLSAGLTAPSPPDARPRLRSIAAVVNAASGAVGPGASAAVAELVAAYGCPLTLWTPAPDEIGQAVRSAVDAAPDLLLILAGDGTARLAAELCGPDGPLLAPLPGGTMNMLPHVLYGDRSWQDALKETLELGLERHVSGGAVGGQAFYVAAILGAPALWARVREAIRAGKFAQARLRVGYALRRAFAGDLHYRLEGRPRQAAEALVLICPAVSRTMEGESALEVAALEVHGAREVFRLAFHGLAGDWRCDPGVTVQTGVHGRAGARRSIPCILDGEVRPMPRRVDFEFRARGFRALAPPPAPRLGV